ncbi:Uncharacterised protein [Escherichia coli]|uniref:Uncharacterized protein n=1 Tax=Escherichia coli TaxID=562 RepID=A0A376KNB4_ECOLX|nr:Uncharacterised protein [Escherichia coli]
MLIQLLLALNVITSLYLSMKLKLSAKKNTSGGMGGIKQYLNRTLYGRLCPVVISKMGQNWDDYDHLTIEVEKNGAGSKLYITFKSPSDKRLNSESLRKLMLNIKDVAEGKIR